MPTEYQRQRATSLLSSIAEYPSKEELLSAQPRRSLSDSYRAGTRGSRERRLKTAAIRENETRSSSEELEMSTLSSGDEEEDDDDEETGLTGRERREQRRRKKRSTQLDERLAGAGDASSKQIEDAVRKNVAKALITNAILIGLWYCFSLSISVYNKWMFAPNHLNFNFPLFTTCVHMLVQFSLACVVLYFIPRFRPGAAASLPHDAHRLLPDDSEETEKPPAQMTGWYYISRVGPCGAATGLDIGFGNMSLKYISLAFYTMCKSSSLAFVLIFAFLFHLEQPSVKLILIIATMTIGVIMMVAGEVDFSALGFVLVVSASFFSGFRWSLTQILLLRNPATSNPFSSIAFLAPLMFLSLLIIAVPVEGPRALLTRFYELADQEGSGILAAGILLFPGLIAFLMTASEFALLQRTSVVTLSIAGIFKEVVTIGVSTFVFGDKLTPINFSGLLVTIASIVGYNYIKFTKLRAETRQDVLEGESHGTKAGYKPIHSPELVSGDGDFGVDGTSDSLWAEHPQGFSRHRASASFSRQVQQQQPQSSPPLPSALASLTTAGQLGNGLGSSGSGKASPSPFKDGTIKSS